MSPSGFGVKVTSWARFTPHAATVQRSTQGPPGAAGGVTTAESTISRAVQVFSLARSASMTALPVSTCR